MVAEDPFEKPPNGKMDCKSDNKMDRNTKDYPRRQKEGETVMNYAEDLEIWLAGNDVPEKFIVSRIIDRLNDSARQWAKENFKDRKGAWTAPTSDPLGHVQKFLVELAAAMKESGLGAKAKAIDRFHTAKRDANTSAIKFVKDQERKRNLLKANFAHPISGQDACLRYREQLRLPAVEMMLLKGNFKFEPAAGEPEAEPRKLLKAMEDLWGDDHTPAVPGEDSKPSATDADGDAVMGTNYAAPGFATAKGNGKNGNGSGWYYHNAGAGAGKGKGKGKPKKGQGKGHTPAQPVWFADGDGYHVETDGTVWWSDDHTGVAWVAVYEEDEGAVAPQ